MKPTTLVAHNVEDYAFQAESTLIPLAVASDARDFKGTIRSVETSGVHFHDISAPAHVVRRTPELIARSSGDAYYKISLLLSGSSVVRQSGREAILQPGDMTIYDTTRPYTLVTGASSRTAVIMIPRDKMQLPATAVKELTAVRIDGKSGVGAIASPMLAALAANMEQFVSSAGSRLAHHSIDLVTTVLVSELGADRMPTRRAMLLQSIYDYIEANLSNPDMSTESIAADNFISSRYLQALFQEQETTVSRYIRQRRLERCRQDLTDPLKSDRPIASIAADWGFLEPTYFSRVFRDYFQCSPRDLRAFGSSKAAISARKSSER